jgi:zinc and cadmium transporter
MLLFYIITASFIVSLISFVGVIILFWKKLSTENALAYFVSFAAGIMLSAAFLDLLPEALSGDANISKMLSIVLLGVVLFFFLERFVLWFHHHHDVPESLKPSTVLITVGDGVHNFIDGVTIAAAFLASPVLGIVATLAIVAHEIPQEIADFVVLLHGGLSVTKALILNFLSGITAILGSILGYFFLEKIQGALPYFLAFSAGMFIYIACSDLIPDLHREFAKEKRWRHSIPFILGIVLLGFMIHYLEG